MQNKSVFKFKKFEVIQDENVFKIGTDAVLLAILSQINSEDNLLEIGTGTGIVSLMLAQINPKIKITGIEIDEKAYQLTKLNFENSIFKDRLEILNYSIQEFNSLKKYDFIVSNPPYYPSSEHFKNHIHQNARSQNTLNYSDLIIGIKNNISISGKAAIIFPVEYLDEIESILMENNFHKHKKWNIFGIEGGKLIRIILIFSQEYTSNFEETDFILESSPRIYSNEYIQLTKDFHLHF